MELSRSIFKGKGMKKFTAEGAVLSTEIWLKILKFGNVQKKEKLGKDGYLGT